MTRPTPRDYHDCHELLQTVFGHSGFKGKQKEIVEAAIDGRDVFVLAPTGMGKSLCFQLPAVMAKSGVTLVISPLCSLMTNQVDNLHAKGVKVVAWTHETGPEGRKQIEKDLVSSHPTVRLLYISPEKYATSDCTRMLDTMYKRGNLNRLVVDEAHCISQWGHSFRSEYRGLGKFRARYGDIPIMALTATATQVVQCDLINSLKMDEGNLYRAIHPFNRENLYYEVRYFSTMEPLDRMQETFKYLTLLYERRGRASSGIIYCRARATCDALSAFLRGKGLNAKSYHRGISPGILKQTLKQWTVGGHGELGGVDLVVATVAFGLGIDKGDVRYIIHYDLPTSFEGYYQETGRAGRDGQPSKCILYYSREDAAHVRGLVTSSDPNRMKDSFDGPSPTQRATTSIDELVQYAENVESCRHISICRYFGEIIDSSDSDVVKSYCDSMCDACKYSAKTRHRFKALTPHSSIAQREPRKSNTIDAKSNPPLSGQGFQPNKAEENKRGYADDPPGPSRSVKKARTSSTRPLTTLPFESAKRLTKPFKPPTKMPNNLQPRVLRPHISESHMEAIPPKSLPRVTEEICAESQSDHPEPRSSSPKIVEESVCIRVPHLPDVDVELENPSSEKLPLARRMTGFNRIRRALHGVKFDQMMGLDGFENSNKREQLVCSASREIEFNALSLSSTAGGYITRVEVIIEAILYMSGSGRRSRQDDDVVDDAEEITGILQRLWQSQPRKERREA